MRIWHEKLIPKLCQPHLCAVWREGLGAYKIITENKKGYRNHPATQEFIDCPNLLWERLSVIRDEMLGRGYNPKPMPEYYFSDNTETWGDYGYEIKEWQTLEEQIEVLKAKGCKCKV